MIIIIASLPSHSATSLGAVFPYVQCVCSPAGFGLFFNVLLSFFISFLFSWLLQFYFILFYLENQGCDFTSDITRLTFKKWLPWYLLYNNNNNERLTLPPSGRSEISNTQSWRFILKRKLIWGLCLGVPSHLLLFTLISLFKDLIGFYSTFNI